MGRKKIAIKKQEDQSKRHETFSKRRIGLFNEAAELCMLNGAQIAILVSSPSDNPKVFSFGHPSADAVIDPFLTHLSPVASDDDRIKDSLRPLHRELRALEREMKTEMGELKEKLGGEEWWASDEYKKWESIEENR
ncbi:hypothetical protein F0562_004102 [Nyssa sinensis]|uniref:MADS-box domain-containing protein n=1 Tax=Nyssa sinensis TaxID=561372 RepID=A0A5J5BWZ5_9ASTE|nr:hypothetical protein F0562_004102 [Nyssa sinensis]